MARTLTLWSMDDVFSIDPPTYLMNYWLLKGGRTVIWGKYGTAKSLLTLEWAIHLALGEDWGEYEVSEPIRVAYIYSEGATDLQHRLAAWAEAHGYITVDNLMKATGGRLMFLGVNPDEPSLDFWKEADVEATKGVLEKFEPSLVIFDPLAKLWPGIDNNTEENVGKMLKTIEEIRHGAAVLLVTHAKKDQSSFRGVTTLVDLTDVSASMNRLQDASIELAITPSGDGHKNKFAEPNAHKHFLITQIGIGPSIHPKLHPAYGVYLKHVAGPVGGKLDVKTQVILAFMPGETYSPKEIKGDIGIDGNHVDGALKELHEGGYLTKPKRGEYELTEMGERWLDSLRDEAGGPGGPEGERPDDESF